LNINKHLNAANTGGNGNAKPTLSTSSKQNMINHQANQSSSTSLNKIGPEGKTKSRTLHRASIQNKNENLNK
jgi:hypothetical protein